MKEVMLNAALNINVGCARIDEFEYIIAEDWPTLELSQMAARTAASMLHPRSGYGGSRQLDNVADFIAGLLHCREKCRSYGCSIMVANVVDEPATDF
jgi:hypothetical protein